VTDKETFLKARLPEREVDLEGVGTVRVRSLSRAEAGRLPQMAEDPDAAEVFILATGLVDPSLSEDEVRTWLANATAGEVETVTEAILALSGLLGDAVGEARRRFPERPGPAGGVPSGPDTGHDGGPAA
jgi:hypothetical protein